MLSIASPDCAARPIKLGALSRLLVAFVAPLALAACAGISDAIWPPVEAPQSAPAPSSGGQPVASATNASALSAAAAETLRGDLLAKARAYRQSADAAIDRLASGAPSNDPELRARWSRAAGELDKFAAQVTRLSTSSASSLVPGGQALLACERDRLTALGAAISGPAAQPALFARAPNPPARPSGRAFVTIRFDRPSPAYEDVLYRAVSDAIERKPDVNFDLEAAPAAGGPSEQVALAELAAACQADKVRRSLIDLGLAPERLAIAPPSPAGSPANEVRVYLR